jgi:hypothetical protein
LLVALFVLQTLFDSFALSLVAWLIEQRKHVLLVSLYTWLVEWVYTKEVAANTASNLEDDC